MKAMVCTSLDGIDSLELQELDDLVPGRGEVVLGVQAAGANFPDLLIVQGKYQFKPEPPFSPGGEVAGKVIAVGEGVEGWSVGDAAIALMMWGGYAEQVVVRADELIAMPASVDPEVAAGLMLTYATCMHAFVDRARLKEGETVLVLGAAGGVGMASIDLAKAMGARVIAAASTDDKLAACREAGADEVINYTTEDLKARAKALTDGNGVDVVVDPVGGAFAEPALRAMGWKGRYLVIGFAAGDIPKIPLNLTLLKGCDIVGVFWGKFAMVEPAANQANIARISEWLVDGKLKPLVSSRYPLAEAQDALAAMAERQVKGKVVLTMAPAQP